MSVQRKQKWTELQTNRLIIISPIYFRQMYKDKLRDIQLPLVGDFDLKNYNDLYHWIANTVVVCYFHVDFDRGISRTFIYILVQHRGIC